MIGNPTQMSFTRIAALIAIAAAIGLTATVGPLVAIAIVMVPAGLLIGALSMSDVRARAGSLVAGAWTADEPGWDLLARELSRSRRYGRSLVLLRVHVAASRQNMSNLMTQLGGCVRATDRAWIDGPDMFVVMPESTHADATRLTERMRSAAGQAFADVTVRAAAFPDDALSGPALKEAVTKPEPTTASRESLLGIGALRMRMDR